MLTENGNLLIKTCADMEICAITEKLESLVVDLIEILAEQTAKR